MANTTLKAIETHYKGYRFRSRLEARWAVFFDTLGVRYEYEKEGFDLGEVGWYLPDFWLPDCQLWVEIKPRHVPTIDDAQAKVRALATATGRAVLLICGNPWPDEYLAFVLTSGICEGEPCIDTAKLAVCRKCPAFAIEQTDCGWTIYGACKRDGECRGDKGVLTTSSELMAAYTAARSARFEHGESGATNSRPLGKGKPKRASMFDRLRAIAVYDLKHKDSNVLPFPGGVYLAGRFHNPDWRASLTHPSFLFRDMSNRAIERADAGHGEILHDRMWHRQSHALLGALHYVGPFYVSLESGEHDMPRSHSHADSVTPEPDGGHCVAPTYDATQRRSIVAGLCLDAIRECDLVFAWIDSPDCYGTIAELGYAHAHGKEIWIAGPESLADLWFVYELAHRFEFSCATAREAFESLIESEVCIAEMAMNGSTPF